MDRPLILYDGVCHLCNGFVRFILKRDHKRKFQFGYLQSAVSKQRLSNFPGNPTHLDTVVLIDNDRMFTRSAAALRIARHLGGGWSVCYGFMIVPAFLRDAVYDLISRHRYRLFGRSDHCQLPSPGDRDRFID